MYILISKICYKIEKICRRLAFYFMFKGNKFDLKNRGL